MLALKRLRQGNLRVQVLSTVLKKTNKKINDLLLLSVFKTTINSFTIKQVTDAKSFFCSLLRVEYHEFSSSDKSGKKANLI